MRYIPASILEKINKLRQTKAENADPKINLVMQRTNKYIEQGSELQPYNLWQRSGLGPLAVAYRRPDKMKGPDFIYLAYIENGYAHMVRQDYSKSIEGKNQWQYLYPIGSATDIAIEFDGRWERTSEDAELCFDSPAIWSLATFGEPWIFYVAGGALIAQLGQGVPYYMLADSGVTRIAAIRGWKNTYLWNHDQGIIVAYVRDGVARYRNYARQPPNLPAIWEEERTIAELPSPVQKITAFRTNDYRSGIAVESNGEIHWVVSARNWSTMALEPHIITAAVGIAVGLTRLTRSAAYSDHVVTAAASLKGCFSPAIWPQVVSISNPGIDDTTTILIECDLDLYGDPTGLQTAFSVKDSVDTPFAVSATSKGAADNIIKLTTATFEGASGDLTVTYTHAAGPIYHLAEGGCMMELFGFVIPFTPLVQPPEGFTAHTVTAAGNVAADFIHVDHVGYYTGHTITAAGSLAVELIPVGEIPP